MSVSIARRKGLCVEISDACVPLLKFVDVVFPQTNNGIDSIRIHSLKLCMLFILTKYEGHTSRTF